MASVGRKEILDAMQEAQARYFVWDGADEDDRPATQAEMQRGIEIARREARSKKKDPATPRRSGPGGCDQKREM